MSGEIFITDHQRRVAAIFAEWAHERTTHLTKCGLSDQEAARVANRTWERHGVLDLVTRLLNAEGTGQ